MLDHIIVGQGIAGSMLSWFLVQENRKILVMDDQWHSSATGVASGVSNPITGRKFVKTWMADEILPFAESTYREFEQLFNTPMFYPIPIIHLFDSVKSQNDWSVRCASAGYQHYLKNENIISFDKQKVKNDFGGFEINGGSRLETGKFLKCYKDFLQSRNLLLEEKFSCADLEVATDHVLYKGMQARNIIFCEGAQAIENPYFKFLPFQLAKGECLIIQMDDFYPESIIIGEVFIMPTSIKGEYYVGSTHEWNFYDDLPSETGKNELVGNLSTILNAPFQIKEHKAAIRPTVKDRRPFIGFHPEHPAIGIFNGMGTKGISLAPYFARHFTDHMVHHEPLMKETNIERFL